MLQRTTKLFVGKDVSRTAQVVANAEIGTLVTYMVSGELVVLDKYKKVLAAGSTISDSEVIYIAQGTGVTFDYVNHAGTAITGARKLIISDPIEGAKVKSYVGKSYSAKVEQVEAWDLTGLTVTSGVQYFVRFVYKDIPEHPGQFVQQYSHVATSTALDTLGTALAAAINKDPGRRVNATYTTGTDVLQFTAREIADSCTALTDIDEFRMVEFSSFLNYIDSDGDWQEWADRETYLITNGTLTANSYGSGNWEQIRDLEKSVMGYRGVMNKTFFPIITPEFSTVVDSTYHTIVIEHDKSYASADNQYVKQAPLTTIVACTVPSSGTQLTSLLAQLNPWMASCPGAFGSVSF